MNTETLQWITVVLNLGAGSVNLWCVRRNIRTYRAMRQTQRELDEASKQLDEARVRLEAIRAQMHAVTGRADDVAERLQGMPDRLRFIKSPTDPERVRLLEGYPFSVRETAIGKPFRAYNGDKEIGQFDSDQDAMSHCVLQAITNELKDRGIEIDEAQGIQIDNGPD
jgi:hypothetical protein